MVAKGAAVNKNIIDKAHSIPVGHTAQQDRHTPGEVRGRPTQAEGGHRPLKQSQMRCDGAQLPSFGVQPYLVVSRAQVDAAEVFHLPKLLEDDLEVRQRMGVQLSQLVDPPIVTD